MKGLIALFFFLLSFLNGTAQNYSFISYSTSQGLPQSQVTSIVQDEEGYLWVGTLGGLARFNGQDFITYSSETGLLNNRISFLTFIDGDLWIGHEGGITSYTKSNFHKLKFKGEDNSYIVKSIIKFRGRIIVATNGGGVFDIEKNQLRQLKTLGQSFSHIRDLLVVQNRLYLATKNGVVFTDNLKTFTKIPELRDYNSSGIRKWGNQLIITTFEKGMFIYKFKNKKINQIALRDKSLVFENVMVDSQNRCWINTESGILLMDSKYNLKRIDESNGLPIGVISSIYEDYDKNIWFGTLGKGLLRFPSESFVSYTKLNGLSSDLVININQDKEGELWFGTFDKGIMKMTKKGKLSFLEFPNNRVWSSVFQVDGFDWFGTDDGLVQLSAQNKVKIFKVADGIPGEAVTAFYKINAHQMYIGGSEGISLYKNKKIIKVKDVDNQEVGVVRDFSYNNNQLILGSSKGLFVRSKKGFQRIKTMQKPISCIEKDDKNNLWVGTEEGLFIYANKKITQLFFSSIPSSNLITFLNFRKGKMYVGTNNGLYVISSYQKEKPLSISHFGIGEGLVDVETNLNSGFFDNTGVFWFGTSSGLVKYTQEKQKYSRTIPQIKLKSILLNYSQFDYSKYSKKIDKKGFPIDLVLPYSKNNLTFEIDGISLVNHSDLSYQFWLEGLEEHWSPISKNTIVSFTGLGANHYTLHARSVSGKGVYSKEIKISFIIRPAFYKTWWFISLITSSIIFVAYQFFRFRIKRELEKSHNEMVEYKSKLMSLEQKSLNASMNRHFIFNSLNSIQYFINSQDRLSANRYLTNFAKLIRKNLDATTQEGNMITLTQELEGLELYLSLESMRFKDRFTYEVNCKNIDTDSVIIPAMLLQPFIENCIVHGILPNEDKLGKITIDIKVENNILIIQIDDNGIGIKNSFQSKHGIEGDHRSQGMEITTKRIDLIKKISNKGFEIVGPYQIGQDDHLSNGTRVLLKIPFENLED